MPLARPTAVGEMTGVTDIPPISLDRLANCARTLAPAYPRIIPNAPPTRHSVMDSSRNCHVMSERHAPRAFLSPISRILSVTLVSIMFMMPMPPTTSDTPATQVMSAWNAPIVESSCSMTEAMVVTPM